MAPAPPNVKPKTNLIHAPASYARIRRQSQNAPNNSPLNTESASRNTYEQPSFNTGRLPPVNASHAPPPEKASTFAGIARAAHETQPGNRKIAPKAAPGRPRAPRNDKRVLIRLQKDSTIFDKGLQIQLAIRDRLHLQLADPLKSRFRLLGLGDLSFQPTRPRRLTLCNTCWLYHPPTQCQKPKVCGNCGGRSHDSENCETHPICVGCSGPHGAGSSECFALPKRTAHGSRALSKTEQSYAIQQGKAAYVRWELSKQGAKSLEATQASMTVQETPGTERTGAENHAPTVIESQHSTVEEGNTGDLGEPDLSEGSMDTDGKAEEQDEEDGGEDEENEEIEETIPLPPLLPLTQPATEQNTTSQPQTA
ncbi:hypothetical protein MY8738_008525 [Beauveria namnaoensis]